MKKIKVFIILIFICICITGCKIKYDINENKTNTTDINKYRSNEDIASENNLKESPRHVENKSFETEKIKDKYSDEVVMLINEERKNYDLPALETSSNLTAAANIRAIEISERDHFSNTRPNGKDWITVNEEYDVKYTSAAENIASGYTSPTEFLNSLINKEETRNTILNSEYSKLGVGVYKKGNTIYWELLFVNDESFQSIPKEVFAKEVLELTNEERIKEGLPPLGTYSALNHAADRRGQEIEHTFKFDHTRPDGRGFFTVLGEYDINYSAAGENIAKGQLTPQEVLEGWMNSPGHRQNILNSDFNNMGVGIYHYDGIIYWTQLFTN